MLKPRRIHHTVWNARPEPARINRIALAGHTHPFSDDWISEPKAMYNLRLISE